MKKVAAPVASTPKAHIEAPKRARTRLRTDVKGGPVQVSNVKAVD